MRGCFFCCVVFAVIDYSSFFFACFLGNDPARDDDRNIRKTHLPSHPVISRTATVDYERGGAICLLPQMFVRIGEKEKWGRGLCLSLLIVVSPAAAERERILPWNCVCGVGRLLFANWRRANKVALT